MPTDTTHVLRPPRRTNPTISGRAITLPVVPKIGAKGGPTIGPKMGPVTESFFARGDEQEASGYQNLAADDPLLAPPEQEFNSFDKIPRRRGSWFAIAVSLLVVGAVGVVTWRSFHFLSRPGSSVAASSRAMVQTPPAPQLPPATAPQPEPAMTVAPPPPAQSTPTPTTAPPAKEPIAQEPARAVPAPPAKAPPAKEPIAQEPARAVPAPIVVPLVVRPLHHSASAQHEAPLRGYVWSPDKRTLVPAEPAAEDPLPSNAKRPQSLDGTPAEEPQPPSDPTSPAPFEPPAPKAPSALAPTESAPIVE